MKKNLVPKTKAVFQKDNKHTDRFGSRSDTAAEREERLCLPVVSAHTKREKNGRSCVQLGMCEPELQRRLNVKLHHLGKLRTQCTKVIQKLSTARKQLAHNERNREKG